MQKEILSEPPSGDALFSIDQEAIQRVWQKWKRVAPGVFLALFLVTTAGFVLFFPRHYVSTTSVSIQQTAPSGLLTVAMGSLSKSGGATAVYSGVIKSRSFAKTALATLPLQKMYSFDREEEAIQFVQSSVDFIDLYDGLNYIEVSLPGPPRFLDKSRAELVSQTAQDMARLYVASLQKYLSTTNSDRESALLRQADALLKQSQSEYMVATRALTEFVQKERPGSTEEQALALGIVSGSGETLQGLQGYYRTRAELEIQIRAVEEQLRGTTALAESLTKSPLALPGEDPLLAEARRQVRDAQLSLQTLRISLAETNPEVVAAKARLQLAKQRLATEQDAVEKQRTSASVELAALRARYATVQKQITRAEGVFRSSRNIATRLELLQNDVALKLEVLKAAETNNAKLQVETVAGNSRMDIVDPASLPYRGKPGLTLMVASGFAVSFVLFVLWLVIEYIRQLPREKRIHMILPAANGYSNVSVGERPSPALEICTEEGKP